jgi:TetR/AcrR family transcriptional regulator
MARRRAAPTDSRARILAAAAAEFAARGFAGANVDRIARAAHVNKALIYYYFLSKAALYQNILREMFDAVAAKVRDVAASDRTPEDKLAAFVEAIARTAAARPHFPPIWLREIAEGGRHLDDRTLRHLQAIPAALGAILAEGRAAGRFAPANPLLTHFGIVGPLVLYFASAPVRRKFERLGVPGAAPLEAGEVIRHVQRITLRTLAVEDGPRPPARGRRKEGRRRS